MNNHFTGEERRANKQNKIFNVIKITMRYHYANVRMAKTQNSDTTECRLRSGENGSPIHRNGNVKWYKPHSGEVSGSFLKTQTTI